MRQRFIFVLCLLLLGASLAINALVSNEAAIQLRGVEYPLTATELPFRVPRLGVNADLLQYSEEELNNQLALMEQTGIVWVRQFVYWNEIEPIRGKLEWSAYDIIASVFHRHPTVKWIPVLFGTPSWAASPAFTYMSTLPPDDVQWFSEFATIFAERYSDLVTFYQVWDEPNLFSAWGNTPPQASQYLAMLAVVYQAIHASDSQAQVIAAALAPTLEITENNTSDLVYLDELYKLGLKDYSDAIATKPYGFELSPLERENSERSLDFSRVVALRDVMRRYSDNQTSLWLSEWGWNTLPNDWQGDASIWGQVTGENRVSYTISALDRIETEWPYVGGAVLAEWQPDEVSTSARWGFALVGQDDKPTPLLSFLQQSLKINSPPSNGFFAVTNPFVSYSGLWTFSELGADVGWLQTSDSRFSLRFAGRDIALRLREGNYVAFLYPQIDNKPANQTQRDSNGNSYVFLQSDSQFREINTIPIATQLSLGEHTLTTVADKGWDQWALAGFVVSDGDLALPYRAIQNVTLGAMLLAIFSLAVVGWQLSWRNVSVPLRKLFDKPTSFLAQVTIGFLSSFFLMIGLLLSVGDVMPHILRRESLHYAIAIVVSGGLMTLQPPVWIAISAFIVLFLILYRQPLIGVLLILGYAPFFLFPVKLYLFAFPMTEILIFTTLIAALLHEGTKWASHRTNLLNHVQTWDWNPNNLDLIVLLLFPLGVIAYFVSPLKSPAVTELRTLIIEPVLFYVLLRRYLSVQTVRYSVYALLIAASVVSVIGVVLFFTGQGIITAEGGSQRLTSVYGSPNNVALLLGRCIPFALSFVLTAQRPQKWLFIVALVLFLITAVLTQSTGALFLGIPAGIVTVLILYFGKRALLPVSALVTLMSTSAAILVQVSPRVVKLLSFTEGTNFIRLRVWESTIRILETHPFTGLGLDQFLYQYRGTFVKPDAIWDSNLNHPHNIVLDFWVRLGLLGVIWLLILQGSFWLQLRNILRSVTDATNRAILIGCGGSMVVIVVHGIVDNSYFVMDLSLIFVFLIAIVAIHAVGRDN